MVSCCLGGELPGEEGKILWCFSSRVDRTYHPECRLSLILEAGGVKRPLCAKLVAENYIAPKLEVGIRKEQRGLTLGRIKFGEKRG